METIVSINELEKRMRPGAYSVAGFLGINESLEELLRQDEVTLQKLGISYESIATELEKVLSRALKQKDELLKRDFQEYKECEHPSIDWRKPSTVPIFSIENLPSPKVGYLIDNTYQVFFAQFRGFQDCPCNCREPNWGSFDFLLLNRQSGEYIIGPGLIVHLIREHHFFEGVESPYRVEPFKLAQVLVLVS